MRRETESSERQQRDDGSSGTTRRQVLVAGAAAATAAVAGCSNLTDQSFEASPVNLPSGSQETLQLAETAADSRSISRQGPTGEVEVTITNHVAVYSRETWLADGGGGN